MNKIEWYKELGHGGLTEYRTKIGSFYFKITEIFNRFHISVSGYYGPDLQIGGDSKFFCLESAKLFVAAWARTEIDRQQKELDEAKKIIGM